MHTWRNRKLKAIYLWRPDVKVEKNEATVPMFSFVVFVVKSIIRRRGSGAPPRPQRSGDRFECIAFFFFYSHGGSFGSWSGAWARVSSVKMLWASGLQDTARRERSLVVFGFRVCQNVWFEVGGLSELFIAAVERANVGPVPGVNSDVCPEIKVQRETLPAALERTLDGEKDRVSLGNFISNAFITIMNRKTYAEDTKHVTSDRKLS